MTQSKHNFINSKYIHTFEDSKKNIDNKILVSIITVIYNGEKYLEETILSVINQTYKNIEYIIIDGGSTDRTIDIIKKYEDKIDYWVSEPDKGIYDAMNKGIIVANGKWVNFMNAGDVFFTKNTVEEVFSKQHINADTEIIYGNNQVIYPHKKRLATAGQIDMLWQGSQFSHQSAFISAKFHKRNLYNIKNRIGADFEFFYNAKKSNIHFQYIDLPLASISSGGLSDLQRIDSIVGWWNVIEKNTKTNLFYITIILKEMMKKNIKDILKKWKLY